MDLDALYRTHAPLLLAIATRALGAHRLADAETCVQDAFAAALAQWPSQGPPNNEAAWLVTVTKRRATDILRRARRDDASPDDLVAVESEPHSDETGDLVRMLFVCCHPALSAESQVALALRTLLGFPVAAIARALLSDNVSVEKRLVRARQTLRDEGVDLDAPLDAARVDGVLHVLYALYTEGYSAHAGAEQIRLELCRDALRLLRTLLAHEDLASPRAHALHALMLLQSSRLAARLDENGELVPLAQQDRARWDRRLIEEGLAELAASARGTEMSTWHVEAALAACHATATSFDATDWQQVVSLYDRLLALHASPVVQLSRAIAVGYRDGSRAGLAALPAKDKHLESSPMLAAATADLLAKSGDIVGARNAWRRALELVRTEPERRFILQRLASLDASSAPGATASS